MLAPARDHHHYQVVGTQGSLESGRSYGDLQSMWIADTQMHGPAKVDWKYERTDAPQEAVDSGHRGTDYYVHVAFREAVLEGKPMEFDVYKAMDTAAPSILAADSIDAGSEPIDVPDFRPNESRPAGQMPAAATA